MDKIIQTELVKIQDDYYDNDDFEKSNTLFLEILKKSKHHKEVVIAYLRFVYPMRSAEDKSTKKCIALCEEMLVKNNVLEPLDYLKLGALLGELEDYHKEVNCYLEAEKSIEKKKQNEYANIAWYYDEIAEDYPKAIEYYKKYLEHNRVWFSGNKEKTIVLIKALEEKIK